MTSQPLPSVDPRWGSEFRPAKARAILETVVRHAGPGVQQGTWLDIGCGSGGIAAELSTHVNRTIGIDPQPWRQWQGHAAGRTGLEFHVGTYDDLAALVGHASVDVVVCNQVYEHVPSPRELLRAIGHVLRPGGWCYFAGPNLVWPIEPHVFWPVVHWLPRRLALKLMSALGSQRVGDLDAWSLDYWRLVKLFRLAGFVPENAIRARLLSEAGPARAKLFVRIATRLPAVAFDILAPVSPGFVFMLRKPGP